MKQYFLRGNKGFTLLEVLMTTGIIAIIIGIATPTLSGHITKTRQKLCWSEQNEISYELYALWMLDNHLDEGDIHEYLTTKYNCVFEDGGYTGICEKGGVITFTIEGSTIHTHCSIHGEDELLED